jgi:hypothetical protein
VKVFRKSSHRRFAELGWRERGLEQLRCRYNTPSLQVMNNNYVDDTCGDSGVDDGWSTAFLAAQP